MATRFGFGLCVLLTGPLLGAPGSAQQATEQFIPIGRSPGLSGWSNATWHAVTMKLEVDGEAADVVLQADGPSKWVAQVGETSFNQFQLSFNILYSLVDDSNG